MTSATVGLLVLAGWILDLAALKSVVPGLANMKANTAIGFVLIGLALWLAGDAVPMRGARLAGQTIGGLVALVAALTLAEYIFRADLGIDHLFRDTDSLGTTPGRASPHTALTFLVVGTWLLLLPSSSERARRVRNWVSVLACLIALQAAIGFLYGAPYLYGFSTVSGMAIHTMATFVVVCAGILATRPHEGLMGLMTSAGAGGVIARQTLPVVVVFPLLLGYLRLIAEERWHLFGLRQGISILAGGTVTVLGGLIYLVARSLDRADAERRRLEERLQELAGRDPLTNLHNLRRFEEALEREFAVAGRDNHELCLMMIDLDGLKRINDSLGHAAGDEMIVTAARALSSQLRATDWIARVGGDEFGVLLLRTNRHAAEIVADKLVRAVRAAAPMVRGHVLQFTVSVGLALTDGRSGTLSTLKSSADEALYRSKADGGNRYAVSDIVPSSGPPPVTRFSPLAP